MKRSLLVFAVLACSCSLYAQENSSAREVLSFFTKYNPAVLEKAKQDRTYNEILSGVINQIKLDGSLETRLEMIALVRNFDNSVKLTTLGLDYENALLLAITDNKSTEAASEKYRQAIKDVYVRIWAVSVNVQEELIAQYKQILKDIKKNTALTAAQRAEQEALVRQKMDKAEKYLKQIKSNCGEYITAATDAAMASAQSNVYMEIMAVTDAKREMQISQQARESDNFQVKHNNQKPVAK